MARSSEAVEFITAHEIIPHSFIEQLMSEGTEYESAESLTKEAVKRGWLTQYQQTQILSGKGEKLVFGPYRLVKPLGEGGMGMVFKAWHPRLDRFVALKFILPEHLQDHSKAISRFHREARAIAQLHHPNVVILYDADEIDGTPYIAMEFVDGISLLEMVGRNGPLGISQACEYTRQAALGLQHAFECNLVHRDIKPSNIIVSQKKGSASQPVVKKPTLVTIRDRDRVAGTSGKSDVIKVLDMGLALLKDSLKESWKHIDPSLTDMGTPLGTPDFIAPEQVRDARNVDIRADLYSLGCTFYYVLTGHLPFPNGNRMEKMLMHQMDEPMPVTALRPHIPPAVADIVGKLMRKKPEDRFQTPEELADTLEEYLGEQQSRFRAGEQSGQTATPPAASPMESTRKRLTTPAARQPAGNDSAATVKRPSEDDRSPRESASPREMLNAVGIMNTDFSFDGNQFAEHSTKTDDESEIASGQPAELETSVPTHPVCKIPGHVGIVSAAALSGNGQFAATADLNGQIRIWDLSKGSPREAANAQWPSEVSAIEFVPNDWSFVVYGATLKGKAILVRWDWTTNQTVEWGNLPAADQSGIGCLRFSADGGILAAGIGPQAVTWRFEIGNATNPTLHKGQETQIRALAVSPDHVLMAGAGQSETVRFWGLGKRDRKDGLPAHTHAASITTMDFSPDGKLLALAGLDPNIALWHIGNSSDNSAVLLSGHSTNLLHVQFTPDGSQLVSVGVDGKVFFWDVRTAAVVRELSLDLKLAYRVATSADATRLVAGYSNGAVAFYDLKPVRSEKTPRPQPAKQAVHA